MRHTASLQYFLLTSSKVPQSCFNKFRRDLQFVSHAFGRHIVQAHILRRLSRKQEGICVYSTYFSSSRSHTHFSLLRKIKMSELQMHVKPYWQNCFCTIAVLLDSEQFCQALITYSSLRGVFLSILWGTVKNIRIHNLENY